MPWLSVSLSSRHQNPKGKRTSINLCACSANGAVTDRHCLRSSSNESRDCRTTVTKYGQVHSSKQLNVFKDLIVIRAQQATVSQACIIILSTKI